jgi:hypothetical protein
VVQNPQLGREGSALAVPGLLMISTCAGCYEMDLDVISVSLLPTSTFRANIA